MRIVCRTSITIVWLVRSWALFATVLLRAAALIKTELQGRLGEFGMILAIDSHPKINNNTTPKLFFCLVVLRYLGCLDVQHWINAPPILYLRVVQNHVLLPAVRYLMGEDDVQLVYASIVYSFPE